MGLRGAAASRLHSMSACHSPSTLAELDVRLDEARLDVVVTQAGLGIELLDDVTRRVSRVRRAGSKRGQTFP